MLVLMPRVAYAEAVCTPVIPSLNELAVMPEWLAYSRYRSGHSQSQYAGRNAPSGSQRPKPTVTINPDNHVFIGERVTLTCNIENGGGVQNWRYSWNKEGSDQTVSNDQQYRISDVTENHAGKYTCTGTETGGSRSSHPSDAVLLTVSERPKPTVIINPDNHVFRGEIVTLTCNIENGGGVQNWRYSWNKEGSDQTVSNDQQYRISDVTENHAGKYTCTGTETGGSRSSHPSDAVLLTVSERPKPTVTINPDNHVVIGETVTLTCNIENGGGVQNWRYSWNKGGSVVRNDQQYSIRYVRVADAGKYTCTGTETGGSRSSHPSDAVLLTVSEKPKTTVRLEPQNFIYTGDTVTLTCDLNQSTGWTFIWYRNDQEVNPQISAAKITTNKLSEKLYYTGTTKYYCRALRGNNYYNYYHYYNYYYNLEFSDPVTVTVEERPKAAVTINPDNHVFVDETVTLTCNIENGGGVQNWRYSWNKEGSDQTVSNGQQYRISDVTENHAGKYTCTGTETGGSRSSHRSDAVLLSVSEKPKPELTSNHKVAALAGNLVLLYCELNPTAGWNFYWYKHTQNTETETTTHPSYTIYSVSVSDGGQYWCRAGRGNPVYYTHYSSALWVNVTGESSSVSLIISPSRTQHFTDESLSLNCVDQNKSTEWRLRRYTDDRGVFDCSSVSGTVRRSTCNISSLSTSHTGVYWCESESGGSNPVNITVHERPKPTVTINPDNHVFIGEIVTLTCNIENGGGVQNWSYSWNKEGSDQTVSNDQQYRISDVTENHAGKYTCTGTETGGSRSSHPSDAVLLTVSEKPKPELTSNHKVAALAGNLVLLYCELNPTAGWNFYWYKHKQNTETETTTHPSYTIYSVSVSDGGQYWCRAGRGNPVYYTHYSSALWVNVTERPKPAVTTKPDNHVFVGEIVTLTCNIENGGDVQNWRYSWNKGGFVRSQSDYIINNVNQNHAGKYTCTGTETGGSRSSHPSDAVLLSVSEKPKPELTSNHKVAALAGNLVLLYCELNPTAGWNFYWYKHTQNTETETTTHPSYTIYSVSVSDGGQYWCRAGRGNPVYYTHYSSALWVNVTGESSSVSLIFSPSRTQHFTDESLSLSCVDQSKSTEWRVRRYTDDRGVLDCSSVSGTARESTCSISSLSTSHTGVYWCESESGGSSNPVNITVHGGDVILEIPVHPVTEGESLTLHCLYRKTKPSNPRADFYKDGSVVQNQTSGEMMIHHISKSDEGFYHCKYPEGGESPKSWVIIRGKKVSEASLSVLKMISSAVAAFPYLLSTIILVKCYRAGAVTGEIKLDAVVEAETSI
ncbi:Fc receptor-like protein 5 [Trichomycterus rosablanca]|uniref:Fc receptor-like protein 5 n=1 Tax=Trichomycterus rosablanca TaxID=2290929 RepID=UPI002F35628C